MFALNLNEKDNGVWSSNCAIEATLQLRCTSQRKTIIQDITIRKSFEK